MNCVQEGDDETGSYYGWNAGDRDIENGEADLSADTYWSETAKEVDGALAKKTRYNFLVKNGAAVVLYQSAKAEEDMWGGGGLKKTNEVLYLYFDEVRLTFVSAQGEIGLDLSFFAFDTGMSADAACSQFEGAGLTIRSRGYAEGGTVTEQ